MRASHSQSLSIRFRPPCNDVYFQSKVLQGGYKKSRPPCNDVYFQSKVLQGGYKSLVRPETKGNFYIRPLQVGYKLKAEISLTLFNFRKVLFYNFSYLFLWNVVYLLGNKNFTVFLCFLGSVILKVFL